MAKSHKLGHDKEPSSRSGKMGGKGPAVHSHSKRVKRSIKSGGGKRFRA